MKYVLTQHSQTLPLFGEDTSHVDIEDIILGLSNLCRYSGQTSKFYSVAEHSVYVSHMVPPEMAVAALFHDAAEAYINDISYPIKRRLTGYSEVEESIQKRVFNYLGMNYDLPHEIHEADRNVCLFEFNTLFKGRPVEELDILECTLTVEEVQETLGLKEPHCYLPTEYGASLFFVDRMRELGLGELI